MTPGKKRALKVLIASLLVLAALLVAAQPLAHWGVRKAFAAVPGYSSTYARAAVSFFPITVQLTGLRMVPEDPSLPIVQVEDARLGVAFAELFRGQVRPWASVDHAKFIVFAPSIPTQAQLDLFRKAKAEVKKLATDTDKKLKAVPAAVLIQSLQLRDSEVLFAFTEHRSEDPEHPEGKAPVLWVHGLEATLEGLSTRDGLTQQPTKVTLTGKVARSGTLTAFVTADLLAPGGLTFAGQAALKGQQLSDLFGILQIVGFKASGELSLEVRAGAKENVITGAVQPVLKNANFESVGPDLLHKLQALLIDAAVGIVSDRVPDRNAVATVVPFHGQLNAPDLDVMSAVFATFRNAFVLGLTEALGESPEARAAR